MAPCAFIGDAVTAAGFRLAGAEVRIPQPGQTAALFRRLLEHSELLLITAEAAAELPADELERALLQGRPLVLVIPDARDRSRPPDLAQTLQRQLGMAE